MLRLTFLFMIPLVACQGTVTQIHPPGGQTGEIAPPYCEDEVIELDLDAVSPSGFTGQEVLDGLTGTFTTTATFYDGTTSEVDVTIAHDPTQGAGARHLHGEDARCRDQLELQVRVDVVSANGDLDFFVQSPLGAYDLTEAWLQGLQYTEFNSGDLDGAGLAGGAWDPSSSNLFIDLAMEAGSSSGSISLLSNSETTGDEAWIDVATW